MSERIPPQNLDAERAVLGSALMDMDGALTAVQALDPSDFYRRSHQLIFAAIVEITTRGVQPDTILVADELGMDLERCGGRVTLLELFKEIPSTAYIQEHVKLVKESARRRALISLATTALRNAETQPVDEIAGALSHGLHSMETAESDWMTTEEVLSVDENREHFKTGLDCLDDMTGGIRAGLTLLAGPPGAGKTTLCLQIVMRALKSGYMAGILGADQLKSDQARIIWSNLAGVQINSLTLIDNWADYHKTLTEWPLLWYGGRFTLSSVCAAIRSQVAKGRTFFVVDSLQMISVPGVEKEQDKANEAARELKRLANELSVFLLLTSEYTKLGGAKASMENVRGGTPVTHAAGQVWWLHPLEPNRFTGVKTVEIHVFKNQLGAGDVNALLTYDGRIHRFTDEGDIPEGI